VGMTRQELRDILNARDPLDFVESEILSRIPWIFSGGAAYQAWLQSVATELAIGAENIRIVGSAATGCRTRHSFCIVVNVARELPFVILPFCLVHRRSERRQIRADGVLLGCG